MKLEIQLNHFFCRKRPSYLNICLSKKLKKMRSEMVADRGQTLYGYVQRV